MTSASEAARRACGSVSAATANSAWPTNITLLVANTGSTWAWTGLMSFSPGMSAAVSAATMPGAVRTLSTSRLFSRAWARWLCAM